MLWARLDRGLPVYCWERLVFASRAAERTKSIELWPVRPHRKLRSNRGKIRATIRKKVPTSVITIARVRVARGARLESGG
jgi:hypothetical protein